MHASPAPFTRTDARDTSTPIALGDVVTFRPEFSKKLVGVEFTVDSTAGVDGVNGKRMVGIKRKVHGRWGYRLAYTDDLILVAQS